MTTKSGIYKIINKTTKKFYLGSSLNLSSRFYNHLRLLRLGKHHSKHLQQAKLDLFKVEQKYLNKLSPLNSYNCSFDAGRITMTKETRKKKLK